MSNAANSTDLSAQKDWALRALRALFPASCGIGCAIETWPPPVSLPVAEAAAVETAAEVRKKSFAAGRTAAREALEQIGFAQAVIPAGADRAPVWPEGAIGSISHAGGLAVAVAGRRSDLPAIGVDLEETGAVGRELWDQLMVTSEKRFLASLPDGDQGRFATVIFSIKEAFYKYQYPLVRRWFNFQDLTVEIAPAIEEWRLTLAEPIQIAGKPAACFRGCYRIGNAFTLAAAYAVGGQ